MPEVLDRPRTTAFVEADEEFPIQSTGASAFGEGFSHSRRWIASDDVGWARWFIAILSRDVARLKKNVQQINRELPRFQQFRKDLEQFLRSSYRERAEQRNAIVNSMRLAVLPSIYIHEVLRQCSAGGGPDGLDMGIDLIAEFGALALDYARELLPRDSRSWSNPPTIARTNREDDWYILLRGMARAGVAENDLWPLLQACLASSHRAIRDAAATALYDIGTPRARRELEPLAQNDPDPFIRESVQEFLADMEG